MQIVETAALFPGKCALTNSGDGPFLDLGRENQYEERLYVSIMFIREMAQAIGLPHPDQWRDARKQLIAQQKELERLREVEQELKDLQSAVGYTLRAGAVVRRIDGHDKPVLRSKPGEKRVEVP